MRKYAVKKNNRDKIVAVLNYNEMDKTYTVDIPDGISEKEVPFMLSLFMRKGIRHMDPEWSLKWVQSRIIPSGRQNIGEILKANQMQIYDEHGSVDTALGWEILVRLVDKNLESRAFISYN